MALVTRFDQYRTYTIEDAQLLCVIDPANKHTPADDQTPLTLDDYFNELLGLVPHILISREKGESWFDSSCKNHRYAGGFGYPMDVKLSGMVLKGEECENYKEPDLYPIAIFEDQKTGERALFFPYAITCFTTDKGELLGATRLD